MPKLKQMGMAAGTFTVALSIGFVMQNEDALADRFGADHPSEMPASLTQVGQIDTTTVGME